MDEKTAFEEAGRINRYFLNWRHAAFIGYIVFLFAVVLLLRHIWESTPAVISILLLSAPLGIVLAFIDLHNRDLSYAAVEAAKGIEGGRRGHVYSRLADPASRARREHSSRAHRLGLAPVYWGYSAVLVGAAVVVLWNRLNVTSADLTPWLFVIGSVLAIAAAFIIGRAQYASAQRRDAASEQRRQDQSARQCISFGFNVVESIGELQRGCEYKNREMVGRQEARLRDLVLFAQSISLAEVRPEAVSAFVTLRGVAAEAAADANAAFHGWPVANSAMPRFDVLMKRGNEAYSALEAALADAFEPAALPERPSPQQEDRKGPRSIAA
jgi:hypothetical protein